MEEALKLAKKLPVLLKVTLHGRSRSHLCCLPSPPAPMPACLPATMQQWLQFGGLLAFCAQVCVRLRRGGERRSLAHAPLRLTRARVCAWGVSAGVGATHARKHRVLKGRVQRGRRPRGTLLPPLAHAGDTVHGAAAQQARATRRGAWRLGRVAAKCAALCFAVGGWRALGQAAAADARCTAGFTAERRACCSSAVLRLVWCRRIVHLSNSG
jgi:hypothetical protein